MKKRKKIEHNSGNNLFQLLMFRFFPYWPLFLILSVFALVLAWIYLQMATPVYKINATLLIKDEKKGVENSRIMESLDILTSKKIVENEIEVIRSRTVMRETVRLLHLCSPVFEQGLFSPYSAYTTSPLFVEVRDIDRITESARADFSYYLGDSLVVFDDQQHPLGVWFNSSYGEIRFVKNIYLKELGLGPFYVSFLDPRKVVNRLLGNFSVQPSNKLTTVINLSINDAVPVRGENILNTLIDSYAKAAITDKNSVAINTLQFVEERIKLVEHDLDSLERSIQEYKSARGIVNLSEQGKVFLKNVGDNDQRLSELDMQMAVLDKVENYVIKNDSSARIVPSTLGLSDERLSSLIQTLYDSEVQYERLKKTTAENNPILLSLRAQIENLRPGVLESIRNQKTSLVVSRANLSSTNTKYASVLTTIPQQERELLEANRQQVIKNDVYTFLLQKREEATQLSASTVSDSRLVDKAESSMSPVAPKKAITYGGAIALACIIAIAWVAKKEMLSNKVLFRSEIEALTRIPIAAEISDSQAKEYIVIDILNKPFLTEQFIQLRTSLSQFGNSSKKVLMITSSIGGEGKSFISANFAMSLAGSNKKVLLLDLDFRNPRISNLFNLGDVSGVSDFLLGTVPIEKIIRRTVTHNLFLLSAGRKRTKATEVLLDGNVGELFARLRKIFDHIIVDTPPIIPVVDAYVISQYCDATLFVVRHGQTPKVTLQGLDSIKLKVLNDISIVFNGVKPRGLVKTQYGYGYGSSYEYEYVNPKGQRS